MSYRYGDPDNDAPPAREARPPRVKVRKQRPLTTRTAKLMRRLFDADNGGAGDLQPLKVTAEIMMDPRARHRTRLNAALQAWEMTHLDPTTKATKGAVNVHVEQQALAGATAEAEVQHAQLTAGERAGKLAGLLKSAGVLAATGAISDGGGVAGAAGEPATGGDNSPGGSAEEPRRGGP